jgi:hypothetical protein
MWEARSALDEVNEAIQAMTNRHLADNGESNYEDMYWEAISALVDLRANLKDLEAVVMTLRYEKVTLKRALYETQAELKSDTAELRRALYNTQEALKSH